MVLGFSFFFVRLNHFSEYVFIGLLVIWIIQNLKYREFQWVRTPLDFPILVYLVWILFTVPFAFDSDYSFNEWRKALPRFLIFWFVVHTIKTESQVRLILLASSIGLGSVSLLEIFYYFWSGESVPELFTVGGASRAGALTGSSQWLSTYLVMGFPIVLLGLWCESGLRMRAMYTLICSSIAGALFLVYTRAGWLAIMSEFIVLGFLMMKRMWRVGVLVFIGCLILILLLFNMSKWSFVSESQVTNTATIQLRLNTWGFAFEKIKEHPSWGLTGLGYGKHSFGKAFPDLGPELHTHIHNVFLARAVQIGIPGLLLFAWICGVVLVRSFIGFKYFRDLYVGQFSLAMFLAMIGLIIRNQFDDMFVGSVIYIFGLLAGLLCVTLRINEIENQTDSGFPEPKAEFMTKG